MPELSLVRPLREATAVRPVGPGQYQVDLSQYYTIVGRPNGGYLQCIIARAALEEVQAAGSHHQHALAVSTNYVGSARSATLDVAVDVRRVGRGVSFVHVTLRDGDDVMTESVVTLGTLHEEAEPRYHDARVFTIAPLEECWSRKEFVTGQEINFGHSVELRMDPECCGWLRGEVSERAEVRGWLKLTDGEASWDPWSLLFASDASPPATFPIGSVGWVPTLQLSSYVRSVPVGEWLRVRQWCVVVQGDLADERCEIYDDRGRLVASASQLVMCRFPPAHGG